MVKQLVNTIIIFIIALGCSGNASDTYMIDEFSAPETAYEINKLNLSKNTHQLYFKITEKFPSRNSIKQLSQQLSKKGWKSCNNKNFWEQYEDQTSGDLYLVHKLTEYWFKDNKILILSAMYYSSELDKTSPDNKEQHVILWVQQTSDAKGELSELGVAC